MEPNEAFENGDLAATDCHDRVHRHRCRLDTLREQEADLSHRLATQPDHALDTAALANLADQLDDVIGNESPNKRKNSCAYS